MDGQLVCGEAFRIAQVIALIMLIPVFHCVLTALKQDYRWKLFLFAFSCLVISTSAAIMREYFIFETFRLIEWIWLLLASMLFASACYYSHLHSKSLEAA